MWLEVKRKGYAQSKISIPCQNPITVHMVKVKELKTSQTFIPRTTSNLFRNIQYPHKKLIRGMPQCVHLICKCLRKKTTLKYITEDPIVWISKHDKVWGMPSVHTHWVDEYARIWSRAISQKQVVVWRNQVECGGLLKHWCQASPGEMGDLRPIVRTDAIMQG